MRLYNDVNVSILSMVALSSLFDDVREELQARIDGLSDVETNQRDLLIADGMNHGMTQDEAAAMVDDWYRQGYTYEDLVQRVATHDAAIGENSTILPNPNPADVAEEQNALGSDMAEIQDELEGEAIADGLAGDMEDDDDEVDVVTVNGFTEVILA